VNRPARLLVPLALAASAVVPSAATPAHAVQSLAYTFAVPCNNPSPTPSLVDLPSGTYAVAYVGVCSYDINHTSGVPVNTPCTLPTVGTVPCVSTTINNLPGVLSQVTTGSVDVEGFVPRVAQTDCGTNAHVEVDGQCVRLNAGTITHGGGVMTAWFQDLNHADNLGAFLVTVVWTPL
jgi:hypothetical protein